MWVRRLNNDLDDANANRLYPVRRLEALNIEYSKQERDARRGTTSTPPRAKRDESE